jgi:Flp pilus assembly protein TadG
MVGGQFDVPLYDVESLRDPLLGSSAMFHHGHRQRQDCGCDRRGATVVEFAVIAPMFLLLLAGIMEFGQAFRLQHSLSTIARRGARMAVVPGSTNDAVIQKVRADAVRLLHVQGSDLAVTLTVDGSVTAPLVATESGDEITVAVSLAYSKVGVSFFRKTFGNSVLKSSCTMERE